MFASLSGDAGDNVGLTQQECNTFHNPPLSSGFIPIAVDTNCSVKVGENPSSGSSVSTIDLVIYIVIGVVAGIIILVVVAEIVRRNKRSRHDQRSSALVESQAGVATRRQAPPPYALTPMKK